VDYTGYKYSGSVKVDFLLLNLSFSVFQVKYSSEKSLLLDLAFFTATDNLNRQLLLEIADVSRFGELLSELLDVEFCESCCGERKNVINFKI